MRSVIRVSPLAAITLTIAAVASLAAFTWPLFVRPGSWFATLSGTQATFVLAAALPILLLVVLTQLSGNGIDVKALAMLGVLTAVNAAVRPLGAGTAGIETVFFLLILAGRVYGPGFGFVLGTTSLFASALLTSGVGPWLPYQMLASGFVGLFAGLLPFPHRLRGWGEVAMLAAYGFVFGFVFGWLMDLSFWPFSLGNRAQLSYVPGASLGENLRRFVAFNIATAMGWNLGRALTNVVLITILGPGLLLVFRRAARRAAFTSPA